MTTNATTNPTSTTPTTPTTTEREIEQAWARIAPYVRVTPVVQTQAGAFGLPQPIWLKLELLQVTGSFKARGAFNRILANEVPAAGVVAASGGNHGLATAYAAHVLGIPAEIFVPTISAPVKQQRLREQGATLHVIGENYPAALAACLQRQRETGALNVHAFDQPETIAGQGTCGRELAQQVPDLDTVLVAVGGGGFIAGIAAWYHGRVKIVSVEPDTSQCLAAAFAAGQPVEVPVSGVAADSLGATRIGPLAWEICRRHVAQSVTVSNEAITQTQLRLWQELRVIAEPGGSAALAALLSGAYQPTPGERVGVLVCGANADLKRFEV